MLKKYLMPKAMLLKQKPIFNAESLFLDIFDAENHVVEAEAKMRLKIKKKLIAFL